MSPVDRSSTLCLQVALGHESSRTGLDEPKICTLLRAHVRESLYATPAHPLQKPLNICLGATRGLQHLHSETDEFPKGIIHRDVKPDNILLDKNWVGKISDFGLFKLPHAGQTKSSMVTNLKRVGIVCQNILLQQGRWWFRTLGAAKRW